MARITRTAALVALALAALLVPRSGAVSVALAAPTAAWQTEGPYGDDATAVAVSPSFDTDHIVFMATAYNSDVGNPAGQPPENATAQLFRSTDGGNTWNSVWRHDTPQDNSDLHARIVQIVVSPNFSSDGTVFAEWAENGMGGVIRSTDHGATWIDISSGLPTSSIGLGAMTPGLSISPTFGSDHTIAFTANAGTSASSYLSTNSGSSWSAVTVTGSNPANGCTGLTGGGFLLALGGSHLGSYLPNSDGVCANGLDTLYATSSDGGSTWAAHGDIQAASSTNFDPQHSRLYLAPDGATVIYTDQYGNALRSTDGTTWTSMTGAVLGSYTPVGSTGQPTFIFDMAGSRGMFALPRWSKAAPHLYHSSDDGATWAAAWTGHGVTALNDVAAGGANVIFYAAGNEGILRSLDNGATWKSVGSFEPQYHAVAPAPTYNTDGAVFAGSYPSGLVTTKGQDTNGFGVSRALADKSRWSEPEAADAFNGGGFGDIFNTGVNGVYSLAVSPNYASDHTVFEGDRIGTVNISHDGGATWTPQLINNQEGWYVNALAVSPSYASDHVVYAGFGNLGYGFARSNDSGQTWMSMVPSDRFNEITQDQVNSLQVIRDPSSGLLDVFNTMGGAIYVTQDDGVRTTPPEWYALGPPTGATTSAISPNILNDCTIYVAHGLPGDVLGNLVNDGLYVTHNACVDSGLGGGTPTWTHLTNGLPAKDITSIVLSPNFTQDHTMFVSSATTGVYVSTDAGGSWSTFNTGLGELVVNRLALSPLNGTSATLFAATDAGVWDTSVTLTTSPLPQAVIASTGLAFGNGAVGTTSSAQMVQLRNTGNATLTISGITADSNFGQTNNCGSSLAAGSSCTIAVTFSPGTTGVLSGNLTVTDNALDSPQSIPLTGTGTSGSGGGSGGGMETSTASTQQYTLTNSDGNTWQDMDASTLALSLTPSSDVNAVIRGNSDLWTSSAGYNQDLGIWISGGSYGGGTLVAWKESGGFAGTFSPNAAYVHTVLALQSGVSYQVKLQWKSNKADPSTIWAGAGPIGGKFSPTRLTAELIPTASSTTITSVASTQQYTLSSSDGSTWQPIDGANLAETVTPSAGGTMLLSGNSDLWTSSAGYNQDIGLWVSGGTYGSGQVVAWKESGGFAGTFSPNAAFVQTVLPVTGSTSYQVSLVWKSNKSDPSTIWAGAGPIAGKFSPTRLTAEVIPASSATTVSSVSSTQQYTLTNSDGSTWQDMDGTHLAETVTPSSNVNAVIGGNSDLWTSSAGYNQDIGIWISGGSYGTGQLVAWKESGGFAGTFSPNAAYVQTVVPLQQGVTYTVKLQWKANKNATGATIWAGAGPISGNFSPTRLTTKLVPSG